LAEEFEKGGLAMAIRMICLNCGAPNLIPLDSPRGRGLAKELGVLKEM